MNRHFDTSLETGLRLHRNRFHIKKWFYLNMLAGFVTLVIIALWIANVIRQELAKPTLQQEASIGLLRYIYSPLQRDQYIKELADKSIYIWPPNGILLDMDLVDFEGKIEQTLRASYPDEFETLPADAKYSLLNYTLPHVTKDVENRLLQWTWLEQAEYPELLLGDHHRLISFTAEQVGFSRYRWHEYDKFLYYSIIRQSEQDNFLLFFASVSDVAEKLKFLKPLLLPTEVFIVCLFGFAATSFLIYRWRETNYQGYLKERLAEQSKELQSQGQLMIQQAKHAQMGEMLSMIAHQWRQPLSGISTTAGDLKVSLELELFDQRTFASQLEKIIHQTQFLSQTINDFRVFFSPNKKKESVLLTDIIEKSLQIFGKSLQTHNIQLTRYGALAEPVSIFPNELLQVFLNILKNAQDVLVERQISDPRISIDIAQTPQTQAVTISDNGGGIPMDLLHKIFLPYFTTKDELNGTGLGLYMSKTIIEEHLNGTLTAENGEHGAIFTITLPCEVHHVPGVTR